MPLAEIDLPATLERARTIAREAGALLLDKKRSGQLGIVEQKSSASDLVTSCDRAAEALIVARLGDAFVDHRIVGEEGSSVAGAVHGGPTWYVDPLDGTTNFAHGLPWYAVSMGLELDGEPLVGVVHAPEVGWEFWATRGHGAYLNGTPLRVSAVEHVAQSLLATGFSYDRRTASRNNIAEFTALLMGSHGIRRVGAAALDCAMVAAGWLDGYWELRVSAWDIAAGALLVREAGGRVSGLDGSPYRSTAGEILASNGRLHEEMIALIAEAAGNV